MRLDRAEPRKGLFQNLSLKERLGLVFYASLVLGILCSGALLVQQYRVAVSASEISIHWNRQMANARELRDQIGQLYRDERFGKLTEASLASYRGMLDRAEAQDPSGSTKKEFARIRGAFDRFASTVFTGTDADTLARWEDVAALTNSLMQLQEHRTFHLAAGLQEKQRHTILLALAILAAFVTFIGIVGIRTIASVTRPLDALTRFVDEVDLEEELPSRLPNFRSQVPEIAFVAKSFERLLVRLRGYRALNFRRLLLEKRRADIIAASIADGICLLRGDEIIYVNPVAEKILKVGPVPNWVNAGTGRVGIGRLRDLTDSQQSGPWSGAKAVLKAVERSMPVEFSIEEDGRRQHFLIQAYPISLDLIEQVEHSSASASELLDKFQANTLVVAQDVTLVRESQEAKGHFLATLSHEVKTPVTSLTMATRLLDRMSGENWNSTERSLVKTCVEDVDRLRRLLDDLLTVSRFDTLTQRIEIKEVDLVKLLKHTIQNFLPGAAEKDIALSSKNLSSNRHIFVPMDPSKMTWALSNLLTNAIRHTPRGGGVEAEIEAFGDWVEVRVRDNGPGIEKSRQARIFEKFSPFYDIRVARSGSAGVGLSIAREIVVAHGGRIWVNSEPGSGAEFCFTLPLKRSGHESLKTSVDLVSATKGASRGASASSG